MTTWLLFALAWSVRAQIFALGLRSALDDVLYLWRRPWLLVRSLFAMYVAVPLAAVALVKLLDLPPATQVALLVLAISAGAPLVPRRLLQAGGDPAYVLSVAVASSVLAVISVPASILVLDAIFHARADVPPAAVARLVATSFLVPFLGGIAVRVVAPSLARRLVEPITNVAAGVFAAGSVLVLAFMLKAVLSAGLASFASLVALTLAAIVIGHVLGGPERANRGSLAVLCATRHIGLAVLIASAAPSRLTAALIAAYLLASLLVSTPYLRWQRGHGPAGELATSGRLAG